MHDFNSFESVFIQTAQVNSCVLKAYKASFEWLTFFGFSNADGHGGGSVVVVCLPSVTTVELLRRSMASSTLFRGRRIVDPVPVQRGPLPRDGKYRSSFSGNSFQCYFNNVYNLASRKIFYFHFVVAYLKVIWSLTLLFWSNWYVYTTCGTELLRRARYFLSINIYLI